jgi:hypothetical protein
MMNRRKERERRWDLGSIAIQFYGISKYQPESQISKSEDGV